MMANLRRYLVAGLLVWVPLGVTVLIINFLVDLADQSLLLLPLSWRPEQLLGFRLPGFGFLLVLAVVLVTGIVVANLFGQQLIKLGELLLSRIPVVRSIYGSVKQLTESLFSGSGKSFRKVVLVRYPHATSWTLAFLTGEGSREIRDKTGREIVSVFVPTTPNPTSGFFLLVPRDETIDLDMSVDDGLKMLLSVGVVVPEKSKSASAGAPVRAA
jgi:uncharacterized membrane protein